MMIYFFPLLVAFLAILLRKKYLLKPIVIFLIIIVGMGFNIGIDYPAYINMFETAPSLFDAGFSKNFSFYYAQHGVEFFYASLNVFLASLTQWGQIIFLAISVLSGYFIYKTCMRFSSPSCYVVFMVIYIMAFSGLWNQIRYGLAILMVFYACLLFVEKRYIKTILLVAFAAGIHTISLAIVFVLGSYAYLRSRNVTTHVIALATICTALTLLFVDVTSLLMTLLQGVNSRYSAYEEAGGSQVNFLIRLAFFLVMFGLLSHKSIKNDNTLFMLFLLTCWSLVIWSIAWRIDVLYRIGVMFEFGYLLFVMRKAYSKQAYYLVGLSLLAILMIWRLIKAIETLNEYSLATF